MSFPQIGDRLRAYRVGSGISIDDMAQRLRVSRSAIYRYEDGDVVKIETLQRIGRLLNVSLATLLGVGIEHIANALAFFERQRQLEAQVRRMVIVFGPVAYLLTSAEYDQALSDMLAQDADAYGGGERLAGLVEVLQARRDAYHRLRPGIVNIVSIVEIERFLQTGLVNEPARPDTGEKRRAHARREVAHIAELFRDPPMGVQMGLVTQPLPTTGFQLLFYEAKPVVLTSPFRIGDQPNLKVGIATISDSEDAVRLYRHIADGLWASAIKGEAAAQRLKALLDRDRVEM